VKVLLLVHSQLIPDTQIDIPAEQRPEYSWITEYDVARALSKLGHDIEFLGIDESIDPLVEVLQRKEHSIIFNMLEEFNSNTKMESKIVSLMELYGQKYTGCNSKGLLIAKDKALSKKILKYHNIGTPHFFTIKKNKKMKLPKTLEFPLIVKCLFEEASLGIAKASVVHSEEKLQARIRFIHDSLNQDAIAEEFIEGKELFVGIMGDKNLKVLPIIELIFDKSDEPGKEIYSSRAKWNEDYRARNGIDTMPAELSKELTEKISKYCKRAYRALGITGYARLDIRVTKDEKIFLLEANPNPNIARDDDFAKAANLYGLDYEALIQALIK